MSEQNAKKLSTTCVICGAKLGKYGPGSDHETVCPRCGSKLEVISAGDRMVIRILAAKEPAGEAL